MSKFSQNKSVPSPQAKISPAEKARSLHEWHLRAVADLIEIGMNLARTLRRRVENGDHEAMLKYPVVASAVVRAIALQTRLQSQAADLAPRPAPPRATAAGGHDGFQQRKQQVKSLVEAAIKDAAGGRRAAEPRLLRLDELLEDPALEADLAQRTSGQVAAEMCRILGITPNIAEWPQDALWDEAIREAEARGRH